MLPWWLSGEESAYLCRRRGLDPWSGKSPLASDQLSPCASTIKPVLESLAAAATEPTCCNCGRPVHPRAHALQKEGPLQWETLILQLQSSPRSPQLEKSPHSNEDPAQPEINKIINTYMYISPILVCYRLVQDIEYSSLSDQMRSVVQLCPTLCHPMNRSTPGLPIHHQLPEFTETHVHWVSDAIQPSHPLSTI